MAEKKNLTKEEVKHVAKLSRIKLTEKELELYAEQLSSILDFIDKLDEIDTENIEPTAQVTGLKNVLREDETEPSLTQQQALSSSNHAEGGYVKVKAVI